MEESRVRTVFSECEDDVEHVVELIIVEGLCVLQSLPVSSLDARVEVLK